MRHFFTAFRAHHPASFYAYVATLLWSIAALLITLGLFIAGAIQ